MDANSLTPTELEHLRLLRLGLLPREAAKFLSRDVRTVENYRYVVKRKIGARAYDVARLEGERAREGVMLAMAAA